MIKKSEAIVLAILLLILSFFILDWAMNVAVHSKKDVTVPDLTGKPLIEALTLLSEVNLGLKKDGDESSDKVPAGTILRQFPQGSSQVREGKVVRVILSQGGESAFVPDLAGQTLRSAEITLRTYFLSLGEINSAHSVKYLKDTVISQDPAAKAVVPKNTLVHLTVSEGPPEDGTILMPDLVGKPWDQAVSWAKESKVVVEKTEESAPAPATDTAASPGTILKQDVKPDTVLSTGFTVHFTVLGGGPSAAGVPSAADSPTPSKITRFHFEVPQGQSAKQFTFVLVDSFGSREIWKGKLDPGSKHDIPLPSSIGPSPRIRILVDGILTEERTLQ